MYKFVKIKDENNEFDKTNVSVSIPFNDITLDDLCEAFTDFIKACGFCINNRKAVIISDIDCVKNEEENIPPLEDEPAQSDDEIITEQSQPDEIN